MEHAGNIALMKEHLNIVSLKPTQAWYQTENLPELHDKRLSEKAKD